MWKNRVNLSDLAVSSYFELLCLLELILHMSLLTWEWKKAPKGSWFSVYRLCPDKGTVHAQSMLMWFSLCSLWCGLSSTSVLHMAALNRSGRWENEHILCQRASGLGASRPCSFYHQQEMIIHSMILLRLIRMAVESQTLIWVFLIDS